jgi:diguanylate cyclase (GGDEF)-like protein
MFDLDSFKLVNDKYGHACGDALLRLVGQALKSGFREIDLVARMGGDEFLVILPQLQLSLAARRATHVQELIAGDYLVAVNGQELRLPVACSAGVAQKLAGDEADEVLARADAALYEDKKRRKSKRTV